MSAAGLIIRITSFSGRSLFPDRLIDGVGVVTIRSLSVVGEPCMHTLLFLTGHMV